MKRNFVISVIFIVICFLALIGAIVFNVMEEEQYSMFTAIGATAAAFIAVMTGLRSWTDK